jgi:co-chaperonin GroES (HSP10)
MKIDIERFAQATDLKAEVHKALRDVMNGMRVTRNEVLVATYIAPEKTAGGIIRPNRSLTEDRWQSKCGFVLAMGPIAFKFGPNEEGENLVKAEIGDWVLYRTADTFEVGLGEGASVRFVRDEDIKAVVGDPTKVY